MVNSRSQSTCPGLIELSQTKLGARDNRVTGTTELALPT
jgi:hypothetical protein